MSEPYVCCTKALEDHYTSQIGNGLPYYQGISYQKGYGLGGIFRRLFRSAFPFIVKGTKAIGKEALRTGTRVASDVLSGQDFKESVKSRTKESGKHLAQKAINNVESMIGKGKYKRKRQKKKKGHSIKSAESGRT